jgi:hypothetical protein
MHTDVFFVFNTSLIGGRITKFNFVIKHRKTLYEEELKQLQLREDNIRLLKTHLNFRTEHIESIADILSRKDITGALRNKIIEIHAFIQEASWSPKTAIKKVPEYVIKSLKNEFG